MLAVDSVGVVPAAMFHKEEYAARTIRPKLARMLEHSWVQRSMRAHANDAREVTHTLDETNRPMSFERAHAKYDVADYITRWNGVAEEEQGRLAGV